MNAIHNKLLDMFQQFTAQSAGLLIMQVLVKWGYERVNAGLSSDERDTAYRFWYKLKEISSNFNFDTCLHPFAEGALQFSDQEITQKSDLLLSELQQFSYEESINELASASCLWLSCCTLEHYRMEGESEQAVKQRFCMDWAIALGIV